MVLIHPPKSKARASVGPQLEKLVRTMNEVQRAKKEFLSRREAARQRRRQPPEFTLSAEKQEGLGKCFELWCEPGQAEIPSKFVIKFFRDSGIIGTDESQLPSVDIDLLFNKHKKPKERRISFTEFVYMLVDIAAKVDVELETLVAHILEQVGEGPDFHNVSVQPGLARANHEGDLTGPEKFFYDKSTFTGTWTNGGPKAIDSTHGYLKGFQSLVHREHIQNDHVQRKKATDAFSPATRRSQGLADGGSSRSSFSTGTPGSSTAQLVHAHQVVVAQRSSSGEEASSSSRASGRRRRSSASKGNSGGRRISTNRNNEEQHGGLVEEDEEDRNDALRGPLKFADPSTFTGTWRKGGPQHVEPKPLNFRPSGRTSSTGDASSTKPVRQSKRETDASKGPERFYYDKKTYTGSWKNGGPDAGQRTSQGYHDFSSLVHRDHVQDDHNNRRKSTRSSKSSVAASTS
ncbi:unnamed protein product [Amoebophrya sp. A25]|nr:unnamed protein product [Amoebophrya sp. A25]|eukprot:GSA25T00025598001.1